MKIRLFAGLLPVVAFLSGCAQLLPDPAHWVESSEQVSRVDLHSSFPAVRRGSFEQVNLIELVDPAQTAARKYPGAWKDGRDHADIKYDLVLAAFRESRENPETKRLHRNSVQDRILSVSTSRCNVFKTFLRRQQADSNFWLGSAATVAGVVGALVSAPLATRHWAGAAGILSGVQAEFNSTYYSNLAAHVIVQGIESHQNRLLAQLVAERQTKSIDDYSMEAAIRDAIHFDGTCSTVVGLVEASDSIKEAANPGLPRAMQVIGAVKATAEVLKTDNFKAMVDSGEWDKLGKLTQLTASPLVVTQVTSLPEQRVMTRLSKAQETKTDVDSSVAQAARAALLAYDHALKGLDGDQRKALPTAEAVGALFSEKVTSMIDTQLAIETCTSALTIPAEEYGRARFKLLAAQNASAEQVQSQKALLTAQAALDAALREVESQAAAALHLVNTTLSSWQEAFKGDISAIDQSKLVVSSPPAYLKDACK